MHRAPSHLLAPAMLVALPRRSSRRAARPRLARLRAALAALALASLVPDAAAQSLDAARQALRESLRDAQFAGGFGSLVLFAGELELAGANYRIDDSTDTRLSIFGFPFRTFLGDEGADVRLLVEGAVGWAEASQSVDDVYAGALPGSETSVKADWRTYGGVVGAGPSWSPTEGLDLAAIVDVGLSRIESDASYAGPGADLTASLLDGIGLNWDGWTFSRGGAVRVDWTRALGARHELELVGRYDLRWASSFATDDSAQEFTSRHQALTLRADTVGPTGRRLFDAELGWRVFGAYRRFLDGDLFGVRDLFEVGGALELGPFAQVSETSLLALKGAIVVGEDVTGWTAGIGGSF